MGPFAVRGSMFITATRNTHSMRTNDDISYEGLGVQGVTAYTNATTGYTDIPGGVAIPAMKDGDPAQADNRQFWEVSYQARVDKATGGSATIGLFIDGAINTDTEEVVTQAAGGRLVTNTFIVACTSNAAQNIRLQGKSSDANTLTVTKARVAVKKVRAPGGLGEPANIPVV